MTERLVTTARRWKSASRKGDDQLTVFCKMVPHGRKIQEPKIHDIKSPRDANDIEGLGIHVIDHRSALVRLGKRISWLK